MSDGNRVAKDGEHVVVPMSLMDAASLAAAAGARDASWQSMVDFLNSAHQGESAVISPRGDAEAALADSLAAAEASSRRIADARIDAEAAHREMVQRMNAAWEGGVR